MLAQIKLVVKKKIILVLNNNPYLISKLRDAVFNKSDAEIVEIELNSKEQKKKVTSLIYPKIVEPETIVWIKLNEYWKTIVDLINSKPRYRYILEFKNEEALEKVKIEFLKLDVKHTIEKYTQFRKFDNRKNKIVKEIFAQYNKEIIDQAIPKMLEIYPDMGLLEMEIASICEGLDQKFISEIDLEKIYGKLEKDIDPLFDSFLRLGRNSVPKFINILGSWPKKDRLKIIPRFVQYLEQVYFLKQLGSAEGKEKVREYQEARWTLSENQISRLMPKIDEFRKNEILNWIQGTLRIL